MIQKLSLYIAFAVTMILGVFFLNITYIFAILGYMTVINIIFVLPLSLAYTYFRVYKSKKLFTLQALLLLLHLFPLVLSGGIYAEAIVLIPSLYKSLNLVIYPNTLPWNAIRTESNGFLIILYPFLGLIFIEIASNVRRKSTIGQ